MNDPDKNITMGLQPKPVDDSRPIFALDGKYRTNNDLALNAPPRFSWSNFNPLFRNRNEVSTYS